MGPADRGRQPSEVEGLAIATRLATPIPATDRATATSPEPWRRWRWSTGWPPIRPAAATPTSCSLAISTRIRSKARSTWIATHGYTNLVQEFGGLGAYSYVFNGESGYLEHALASARWRRR